MILKDVKILKIGKSSICIIMTHCVEIIKILTSLPCKNYNYFIILLSAAPTLQKSSVINHNKIVQIL